VADFLESLVGSLTTWVKWKEESMATKSLESWVADSRSALKSPRRMQVLSYGGANGSKAFSNA